MSDKINILFTIPNFITAGSGRVMLNIIERLDSSKFSPSVCVSKKGGALDKEVERLGIPFFESDFTVPILPYSSLLSRTRKKAQFFVPLKIDIWHSFHYSDNYTEPIIARKAGVKNWVYTKKAMGWGSRAWVVKSLLSTRIVADNTDMLRTMFSHRIFRNKVHLIHHGIPTNTFTPIVEKKLNLRSQLGISNEIIISAVANLVRIKGHSILIRAINSIPNAHLVIAGKPLDQTYVQELNQLVSDLNLSNRVHFLGGVSYIPALLSEIDIFALTTKKIGEGCPVALIEAMSCEKPCIGPDIPGVRDIIEHQKSGLLVFPENVASLVDALEMLIESDEMRNRLGKFARLRVLEKFTANKEAQMHEAMYSSILGW
jgi:glycosyltransferase involved in cell wall biosynthesis